MMSLRTAMAIASAVALAACGERAGEDIIVTAPSNEPAVNGAAPGGTAEQRDDSVVTNGGPDSGNGAANGDERMAWNFSRSADGPKLAYGVPQTDNVRLMLRCPQRGEAALSFIRPRAEAEARPSNLMLESGGEQLTLPIRRERGPLGTTIQADANLSAPPLQRFRSGERLEVHWGGETIAVPGSRNGPVGDFFAACR